MLQDGTAVYPIEHRETQKGLNETTLQDPVKEQGVVRIAKNDPERKSIGIEWRNGRCRLDVPKPLRRRDHDHAAQAARVKKLIGMFNAGLTMDADDAFKWYQLKGPRNALRLATIEFMSLELSGAFTSRQPYLHSPVDDIYSHFFVAQWAAVFHRLPAEHDVDSISLNRLRTELSTQQAAATDKISGLAVHAPDVVKYGSFLCECGSLFKAWKARLSTLDTDYRGAIYKVTDLNKNNEELLKSLFMTYAYRGVADYMEVLAEWRLTKDDDLSDVESEPEPED
ncbi:hypothetical protein MIND_00136800 [Mycena indigotica]|uniref:Uncharacterized protein n=1 Tax=Mycena indigotica TaxID=2126181 RepID=A0A8H6WGS1_9AGAR|nr:uncharacterized protein MIND_00136800 [Mycena indigotica]KAF7316186.1 hypothetical protein MIND_00136800 [Mycena indigotica]